MKIIMLRKNRHADFPQNSISRRDNFPYLPILRSTQKIRIALIFFNPQNSEMKFKIWRKRGKIYLPIRENQSRIRIDEMNVSFMKQLIHFQRKDSFT